MHYQWCAFYFLLVAKRLQVIISNKNYIVDVLGSESVTQALLTIQNCSIG